VYCSDAHRLAAHRARQGDSVATKSEIDRQVDDVLNWRPGQPNPALAHQPKPREETLTEKYGVHEIQLIDWLRTGDRELISKAAIVEDAVGQVLVPVELETDIAAKARESGTIRSLVTPRPTRRLSRRPG
jgi:HK97 family phage major capsid protein